jgi:hypothetical protein
MAFAALRPGIAKATAETLGMGADTTLPHGLGAIPSFVSLVQRDGTAAGRCWISSYDDTNVVCHNSDVAADHSVDLIAIVM